MGSFGSRALIRGMVLRDLVMAFTLATTARRISSPGVGTGTKTYMQIGIAQCGIVVISGTRETMIRIDWRQFFVDHSIFGFYIRCGTGPILPTDTGYKNPEKFACTNPERIFNKISWTHLYFKGIKTPWHRCYKLHD